MRPRRVFVKMETVLLQTNSFCALFPPFSLFSPFSLDFQINVVWWHCSCFGYLNVLDRFTSPIVL